MTFSCSVTTGPSQLRGMGNRMEFDPYHAGEIDAVQKWGVARVFEIFIHCLAGSRHSAIIVDEDNPTRIGKVRI